MYRKKPYQTVFIALNIILFIVSMICCTIGVFHCREGFSENGIIWLSLGGGYILIIFGYILWAGRKNKGK